MKILLAIDGSECALAAVHQALGWVAQGLRASFVLVNVQEPPSLYEVLVAHDAAVIDEVSRSAAQHLLAPVEQLLRTHGADFETEVGQGDPAGELLAIAERLACDLVVIGATGKESIAESLGSVAEAMVRRAAVPVTVVRPRP